MGADRFDQTLHLVAVRVLLAEAPHDGNRRVDLLQRRPVFEIG